MATKTKINMAAVVINIGLLIGAGLICSCSYLVMTAGPSSSVIVNWAIGGIFLVMPVILIIYVLYRWKNWTRMD
jgi:L-asparagine transporter-like permease